jgi:hypothetical protein
LALYRASLIGPGGGIVASCEFERDDDAAALEYARQNVMTKPIQVWQGERLVGRVDPNATRKSGSASFLGG